MIAGLVAALALTGTVELPPYVYERARAEADEVLVLLVFRVDGLPDGVLEGQCVVEGNVMAGERGDRREVGSPVTIDVPCVDDAWEPRPGPFSGYDEDGLAQVGQARVWLKDGQLVLRGLDAVTP